jgi:hypothetical protein
MSKKFDSLQYLKQGMSPFEIARKLRVSELTVIDYLQRHVGEGSLRRSDIYFSFTSEDRKPDASAGIRKIVSLFEDAATAFGDMYSDIREIEVSMHAAIRDRLVAVHGSEEKQWWRCGVPSAVRVKCQERRELDTDARCEPYQYTDLLDLSKVVGDNWSDLGPLFQEPYRSNKRKFEGDLRRLNSVRNRVMHPVRGVPPNEEEFDFVRSIRRNLLVASNPKLGR